MNSPDGWFVGRRPTHHPRTAPANVLEGLDAPEWMNYGLCAQTDPEAFYPDKGGSTREAKRVCGGCPVTAECLDYALEHQERFGIWGGLSERERRKLARTRPVTPKPPRRVTYGGRGGGAIALRERMAALGVTAAEVKAWAYRASLVESIVRGLPSGALIDAYVAAHQEEESA